MSSKDYINFDLKEPNFKMSCGAIVFNRDDAQGRLELEIAAKSYDMSLAIYDFDMQLRNIIKYQDANYPGDYLEAIEKARGLLRECLVDHDIDLELIL
jgi:hypothetical protein